jgi:nucleotide-binding universal stress UspA family protein
VRILHPTDFSECAMQAESRAVELVEPLGGELVLLHVLVEAPLYSEAPFSMSRAHVILLGEHVQNVYSAHRAWAEHALEKRAGELRSRGIKASWRVQTGVPYEEIVKIADEERVDMIAVGTHGRGGLNKLLMGSVADRVIRLAPCPVLTVRETTPGEGR